MSPAFIRGTTDYLPNAHITFDKFHVIQALNKVQNEVRKIEQRENPLLKKSKYLWLRNPDKLSEKQEAQLAELQITKLKTAKVYQMKLVFQDIYCEIKDSNDAEVAIKKWLSWAVRSRIEPVKELAKMVKKHWDGIIRYWTSRLTSGTMESINSRIQNLKRRARGYRNDDNFISMIYLEMFNLDFGLPT